MTEPTIIAETEEYLVVDKPAGMATEPLYHEQPLLNKVEGSRGTPHVPTLCDWLIENKYIDPNGWLEGERCGVVHRLDTDTSGVVIWAKNKSAQDRLKLLWQGRQVEKTYLALVVGECDEKGEIELALARDNKKNRQKVVWINDGQGRPAITNYWRQATSQVGAQKVSLVEAHPITGRTHQIRVHFKAIGHPLVGDKLYGEKSTIDIAKTLKLNRHFLHASKICLPVYKEKVCYEATLPVELTAALNQADISI